MKKVFVFLLVTFLASCSSQIKENVVVEKVEKNSDGSFAYRVKFSTSGVSDTYLYTNYKHEVGDSLMSIFEFKDNRSENASDTKHILDSVLADNSNLLLENRKLKAYNDILIQVIEDNTKITQH